MEGVDCLFIIVLRASPITRELAPFPGKVGRIANPSDDAKTRTD